MDFTKDPARGDGDHVSPVNSGNSPAQEDISLRLQANVQKKKGVRSFLVSEHVSNVFVQAQTLCFLTQPTNI